MSISSLNVGDYLGENRKDRYVALLRQFRHNGKAMFGLVVIVALVVVAVLAPELTPYTVSETDVVHRSEGPSMAHLMGTDNLGRDIFTRVLMGTRVSLYVGFVSVAGAMVLGVPIGIVGGYYKGWVDEVLMRLMDAVMSFPPILLALVLIAVLEPGINNVVMAIAIVYTPYFARVARSEAITVSEELYVRAAVARGESDFYILFREVLPNSMTAVLVQASINVAFAILVEAALSFLGLGVQPPTPSWGLMINTTRAYMETGPWMVLFPAMAIGLTVMAFNMLGDALRDILDPHSEVIE